MAGASELAYTLLMMQNEFVAANKNFKNPDEHSEKLNIVTDVVERKLTSFCQILWIWRHQFFSNC